MTINERIRYFRKDVLNMNQRQFAASLGMAQTGVSGTERDGATVTDRFIKSVCLAFNLNEDWLRYGTEPMYIQPDTFSLDNFIKEKGGTELEKEIVKTYYLTQKSEKRLWTTSKQNSLLLQPRKLPHPLNHLLKTWKRHIKKVS